jgi:prolyl oligopeptidase
LTLSRAGARYNSSIAMFRFALLFATLMTPLLAQEIRYPETRRSDHTDVYHGMTVADPYRWLEDDVRESAEVKAWVEAQNKTTFGYLETLPERESIRKRLEAEISILAFSVHAW